MYVYLRVRCIQARYGFRIIVNVKFHVFFSLFFFFSPSSKEEVTFYFFSIYSIGF